MTHREENIDPHHAGNARLLKVQIREPPPDETSDFGDPIDISGATIDYYFSQSETGTSCVFTKTNGSGISIVDAANGKLEITWDNADTDGLSGEYFHECEFTDGNGDKATVFTGTVNVIEGLNC